MSGEDAHGLCVHPVDERYVTTYANGGSLNVPTGPRVVCVGCGHDFGPPCRHCDEPAIGRGASLNLCDRHAFPEDRP